MNKDYMNKIEVDSFHTIYLDDAVFDYYTSKNMDEDEILLDIDNILDNYNILDYRELYISIDSEGGWEVNYTKPRKHC